MCSCSAYGFCGVVIGLTCGVLVLPGDLPPVYNWAYAINPMSYMINGLTLHEFQGRLSGEVDACALSSGRLSR